LGGVCFYVGQVGAIDYQLFLVVTLEGEKDGSGGACGGGGVRKKRTPTLFEGEIGHTHTHHAIHARNAHRHVFA
jgi:hypothetical protein